MNKLYSKKYSKGLYEVYSDKPKLDCIEVNQTHSNIIISTSGENLASMAADGIIAEYKNLKGRVIAIKTADCLPVLFMGQERMALVHAGWKGLQSHILITTELKRLKPIKIFIGPSIYSYEVSSEFKSNFPHSEAFTQKQGRLFFNLQKEALSQLKQSFPNAIIEESNICTLENNQYNSFRRNQTENRNWNIFRLNS